MTSTSNTYGDIAGLITMLQVACEDAGINLKLERLLAQPDQRRREVLKELLATLRKKQAQPELIEGLACLLDDTVAEQAYREIYRGARKSS